MIYSLQKDACYTAALKTKNETVCYSQLSDGKDSACGLPSDTFLVSSCWPHETQQNKLNMKASGVKRQDQRSRGETYTGGVVCRKNIQGQSPAPLHSLALTGQMKGHYPLPCLHLLSSRCSSKRRDWWLEMGLLASWLLLTERENNLLTLLLANSGANKN